jgi:hypothetical protein
MSGTYAAKSSRSWAGETRNGAHAVIADLEDFVRGYRPHGELFADAGLPGSNGYRLEVRCHCGVVFERLVTTADAGLERALLA